MTTPTELDPHHLIEVLREQVAELSFALALQHARARQLSQAAPAVEEVETAADTLLP